MKIPLSFWEGSFFNETFDLAVVGAGFVGLSAALEYKRSLPQAKVVILEKGIVGQGASTKNAGFSCFGSIGELEDDVLTNPIGSVVETVKRRWEGLGILRANIPDAEMDYIETGGWEVFQDKDQYEVAALSIEKWNDLLRPIIGKSVFQVQALDKMNFHSMSIYNPYEGQLNPMKAIHYLYRKAISEGIIILKGIDVDTWSKKNDVFEILDRDSHTFRSKKILVATNGFTGRLLSDLDVKPARNQVLITKPLQDLQIKGNYHYKKGYIYFRHVDNRLLLGGARFISDKENTSSYGQTNEIQDYLSNLLKERILIDQSYDIDQWWSGILGVGDAKGPLVKEIEKGLFAAVRLGGMGVAIGMEVGQKSAQQILFSKQVH